jgi:flagellar hook assembly protein FlgD
MGDELYYKRFTPDPTAVFEDGSLLPDEISIAVYPNPFNSSANITLNDSKGGDVEIEIYDIRGRLIRNLTAFNIQGGDKKAVWDATDNSGRRVSSGIYFARVETPQTVKVKKLLYLR